MSSCCVDAFVWERATQQYEHLLRVAAAKKVQIVIYKYIRIFDVCNLSSHES